MNFSIVATTYRRLFPPPELACSWLLWWKLLRGLRQRGSRYSRESGAFLLGNRRGDRRRITSFVLYDDLDPHCLDTGIVRFNGSYYGALWTICGERKSEVVADVHVHPCHAMQSDSDMAHPMIPQPGHLALILPRFACKPITRRDVGIFKYMGSKEWLDIPREDVPRFFKIGI